MANYFHETQMIPDLLQFRELPDSVKEVISKDHAKSPSDTGKKESRRQWAARYAYLMFLQAHFPKRVDDYVYTSRAHSPLRTRQIEMVMVDAVRDRIPS